MQLDELLSRLDGTKRSGDGFVARCPAHEDHRQSLFVSTGDDGRLLMTCYAGCSTPAVCGAIGISLADLFVEKSNGNGNGNGKRKIVATYDYTDESGTLLYQVVRFEPKDFRQRKPDGAGDWEWKIGDTRRVLYRLPQVLDAVRNGQPVYVVEGEKDAEALAEFGLTATCNPAGAGKWRPEYSEALTGASVTIIADRDEPGRKHAFAVAAALVGKAADINIVESAEGKDASDHLSAGFTPHEFVTCKGGQDSSQATLPAVTLSELMRLAPERPDYVLWGYVAKGAVTEVAAKPKVGKTRFVMEAVARILHGEEFIGHATFKSRVLYMTEESRSSFIAGARRAGMQSSGDTCHVLMRGSVRSLTWDQIGELVLAYCEIHKIDLVVCDTLSDWAGLRGDDENSAGAAMAAVAPLRALADAGLAVLVIRHEGKSGLDEIGQAARGSSAFGGSMDILTSLRRTRGRGHENRRELHAVGRFDDVPLAMTIELGDHGYQVIMENAEGRKREVELQILDVLPMAQEWALSESDLREQLNLRHSTIKRALENLHASNLICQGKKPRTDSHGMAAVYWRDVAP